MFLTCAGPAASSASMWWLINERSFFSGRCNPRVVFIGLSNFFPKDLCVPTSGLCLSWHFFAGRGGQGKRDAQLPGGVFILGPETGSLETGLRHFFEKTMITIDFNVFLALGLIVPLTLAIGLWMFYTLNRRQDGFAGNRQYFMRCPYCAYAYFDYVNRAIPICPRCKSFLEKQS